MSRDIERVMDYLEGSDFLWMFFGIFFRFGFRIGRFKAKQWEYFKVIKGEGRILFRGFIFIVYVFRVRMRLNIVCIEYQGIVKLGVQCFGIEDIFCKVGVISRVERVCLFWKKRCKEIVRFLFLFFSQGCRWKFLYRYVLGFR